MAYHGLLLVYSTTMSTALQWLWCLWRAMLSMAHYGLLPLYGIFQGLLMLRCEWEIALKRGLEELLPVVHVTGNPRVTRPLPVPAPV